MRIGGWIAAGWVAIAWTMLAVGGRAGTFAVASVLIAAFMRPKVVRQQLPILATAGVVCLATVFLSLLGGASPAEALDSALRLFCLVAAAPLAGEYADGFWLCRTMAQARVPRSVVLLIASSFAVLPVLLGDVRNFAYHHRRFSGRKRLSSSMLPGVVVITLDRVEELELADDAFDMADLFERSPQRRIAPFEFIYAVHLVALIMPWSWGA